MKRARFVLPVLLSIIGIILTLGIVNYLAGILAERAPAMDTVSVIPGNVAVDAPSLIYVMLPVYIIEFFILTIPIAVIMLIVNKGVKSAWYTHSVVHTGQRFDAFRMIRRAIAPALFSLSFAEVILSFAPQWLFNQPGTPEDVSLGFYFVGPLFTINGAMITLAVGLAVYMPTWLLNDSGIVSHLKTDQLQNRRCPDTLGVGRWYSNFISGFALLAYPVMISYQYFYRWLPTLNTPDVVVTSFIWSISLPLLMMAFVIPIIILNELMLDRLSKPIQRLARKMGAGEIHIENLEDVMVDVTKTLAEETRSDSDSND
ncbi:MAG: hypothetical protein RTU30_13265 [Candidatus Thorarchaeota archaeon]